MTDRRGLGECLPVGDLFGRVLAPPPSDHVGDVRNPHAEDERQPGRLDRVADRDPKPAPEVLTRLPPEPAAADSGLKEVHPGAHDPRRGGTAYNNERQRLYAMHSNTVRTIWGEAYENPIFYPNGESGGRYPCERVGQGSPIVPPRIRG